MFCLKIGNLNSCCEGVVENTWDTLKLPYHKLNHPKTFIVQIIPYHMPPYIYETHGSINGY